MKNLELEQFAIEESFLASQYGNISYKEAKNLSFDERHQYLKLLQNDIDRKTDIGKQIINKIKIIKSKNENKN